MDFKLQMDEKITCFRDNFMKKQSGVMKILLVLCVLFSIVSCTANNLTPNQNNQLSILEKRVIVLEQQQFKTLADLRDEVAAYKKKAFEDLEGFRQSQEFFIEELDKLKEDMKISTNDNEKAQFNIRRNYTRIKTLKKRLGNQIIELQELQKFFKNGIDAAANIPDTQQEDFNNAFKLYKERQFKKSEIEFIEFRKKYPASDLVDDSIFFIANMYFLQAEYSKASLRFLELLNQYPTSNRLYDAKWWLGVSLERSGDLNGALDIYRELSKLDEKNPLRIKAEFRLDELSSN